MREKPLELGERASERAFEPVAQTERERAAPNLDVPCDDGGVLAV